MPVMPLLRGASCRAEVTGGRVTAPAAASMRPSMAIRRGEQGKNEGDCGCGRRTDGFREQLDDGNTARRPK